MLKKKESKSISRNCRFKPSIYKMLSILASEDKESYYRNKPSYNGTLEKIIIEKFKEYQKKEGV